MHRLDLDERLLPFAEPRQIRPQIAKPVGALASPEGGLMLLVESGRDVPLSNIETIYARTTRMPQIRLGSYRRMPGSLLQW
jgi:hypothetical protein